MQKKILLIEIGTEELPARLLYKISLSFYENFIKELNSFYISYEKIKYFSTPRRIALQVIDIDTTEKFIEIIKKGPSIKNTYDKNGCLTKAAISWLQHYEININQASRVKNKNGEWLLYKTRKKQEKIERLIPQITEASLKNISIQTSMRWENSNQKFFRPIRNIVMLLDSQIITGNIFNIASHNLLHNHISSKEKKIVIKDAKDYPNILFQENNIIANHMIRQETIMKNIKAIAQKINGFIKTSNYFIEEVTALVESPTAILASFEQKFLKIPKEILIHTIEKKQKCFPVYNFQNKLLPYFIFISNIHSKEPEKIITGNQKVMHARLADAEFFLKKDRIIKLENNILSLKKVLFHNNLGSLYEKTLRLKLLVEWIAKYNHSNVQDSIRAALLSKCDLITHIVCEFPELQGTIGMYYSLEDKEKKDVAIALKEQYLPAFSNDKLPSTSIGCALSIADKIDTLSGMFYIGNRPRADKDPFALRRLAIGIMRIIIVKNMPLDLKDLIHQSLYLYNKKNTNNSILLDEIFKFLIKRLFYWYEEAGYNIKAIKSILSYKSTKLIDVHQKIQAISFFQKLDNSKSIILSIKRISNILEKENKKITGHINVQLMKEEEIILFNQIKKFKIDIKKLLLEKKYKDILIKIKELETPICNFFKKVRINDSNSIIRLNRLILLNTLKKILFSIADFSYLY